MYNTMIRAYVTSSTPDYAFTLFLKLLYDDSCNVFPDKYTLTFVLKACAVFCSFRLGQQIHGLATKMGIVFDLYLCNTLVHVYAKCGFFREAYVLLGRMPEKDIITWNAVLSVYTEKGLMELAHGLFDVMPVKNLESWNFLLSGYVNLGLIDEAREVFDEMIIKDVVSWNAMITGYSKAGRHNDVWRLFDDMQRTRVKPDSCTLVNMLSACAGGGVLSQGEWLHSYIDRNRIEVQGFLATALIDMYSKCGCVEKARIVFDGTRKKDTSTWNAMIAGLSSHGLGESALQIFSEMVASSVKPNEITFISLLSACSRSGLLTEGCTIFDQMLSVYRIDPAAEHYGCMVDLLGKYGLLNEAVELVSQMSVKEVPALWESLLIACRNHGNVDLAEETAKKLLEMDPKDSVGYVQLSNIHASMGRWTEASNVRRMMKANKISKEPGSSMIEVGGVVHEFLAGEGIIDWPGKDFFSESIE